MQLSDREKALIAVTAAAALVAGMWVGVTMMPVEALDVPTTTEYVEPTAVYTPVPNHLPLLSIIVFSIAAWYA